MNINVFGDGINKVSQGLVRRALPLFPLKLASTNRTVRPNLDFGPVVKPLSYTVKKEDGKVVETSNVVRTQGTREFRKGARDPEPKKGALKMFEFQNFVFQNFETSKGFCGVVPP